MMSWAVPLPDGGYRLYAKGAPEIIMSLCSAEGDQADKETIREMINVYARRGMRTLVLAYRDFPAKSSIADLSESGLTFVALAGIEDPLRAEIPSAIEQLYHTFLLQIFHARHIICILLQSLR